jgi:hypothetical protein
VGDSPELTPPDRAARSRWPVVAFRTLLLVSALGALASAIVISVHDVSRSGTSLRYACPMHPEVTGPDARPCPICGMALEPNVHAGGSPSHSGMSEMADLTAIDNVRKHKIIDLVRFRSLPSELREIRGPASVDRDSHVTITAVLYRDQLDALARDEAGTFTPTARPNAHHAVTRTDAASSRWDSSTERVSFRLSAAEGPPLVPGEVGWLELARKSRDVLGVPVSALVQSPEGPYVLVSNGSSRFEKRAIEIGETFLKQGFAVVLSGLRAQDRVVGRATFFLDAERRLDHAPAEMGNGP